MENVIVKVFSIIIGSVIFFIDLILSGILVISIGKIFTNIEYTFLNILQFGSLTIIIEILLFLLYIFVNYRKR